MTRGYRGILMFFGLRDVSMTGGDYMTVLVFFFCLETFSLLDLLEADLVYLITGIVPN